VPRPAYRTERNAARDPGDVEGTAGAHRSQQAAAALCVMLKVSAMVQEIAPRQHMVAGSRITQSRLVEPGLQRSIALLKQRRVSPRLAAWGGEGVVDDAVTPNLADRLSGKGLVPPGFSDHGCDRI
jgi:hypothetical protein